MWRQSNVIGTKDDKQCWYMHKEIFSGKKNTDEFKAAYMVKEDDNCLILRNCIDPKYANKFNTEFVCLLRSHQRCGGESPRRLLEHDDSFTTTFQPVVCDLAYVQSNDVIPNNVQAYLQDITNEKFEDLVNQERIALTQKILYVLKKDFNKDLWPFKMPDPFHRDHVIVSNEEENKDAEKK